MLSFARAGVLPLLFVLSPALHASSTSTVEPTREALVDPQSGQQVLILWDEYAVPHVYTDVEGSIGHDKAAYFGAGYAMAKLRLFQMMLLRQAYRGELSMIFGPGEPGNVYWECGQWEMLNPTTPKVTQNTFLDWDERARILGWRRYAELAVDASLPANLQVTTQEVRSFLCAFARGVNYYMDTVNPNKLNPLFGKHPALAALVGTPGLADGIRWKAEDCIGMMLVLNNAFGDAAAGGDLKGYNTVECYLQGPAPQGGYSASDILALFGDGECDDQAAVVQDASTYDSVGGISAMQAYLSSLGLSSSGWCVDVGNQPHFSQAWAVAGSRIDDGTTVLVSEPRIPVTLPNPLVEIHMRGRSFDVRGAAVVGTPNILMGSSETAAWGLTSAGMASDLFELDLSCTSCPDPCAAVVDENGTPQCFPITVETEQILVLDTTSPPSAPVYTIQEVEFALTRFGPIVTDLVGPLPQNPCATLGEYAARTLPGMIVRDPGGPTVLNDLGRNAAAVAQDVSRAFLELYRADDVAGVHAAIEHWSYIRAHAVFADTSGSVGYRVTGKIPLREPRTFQASDGSLVTVELPGLALQDGTDERNDWLDVIPHDFMPRDTDPARGYVYSANHMSIASWYPFPGIPGGSGYGVRAFRLHERLEELLGAQAGGVAPTATQIRDIRLDKVNSYKRDIALIAEAIPLSDPIWDENDPLNANVIPLVQRAKRAREHLVCWLNDNAAEMTDGHHGSVLAHITRPAWGPKSLTDDVPLGLGYPDSFNAGFYTWRQDVLALINAPGFDSTTMDWAHKQYVRKQLSKAWKEVETLFDANHAEFTLEAGPPGGSDHTDCTASASCVYSGECIAWTTGYYTTHCLNPFWQPFIFWPTINRPDLGLGDQALHDLNELHHLAPQMQFGSLTNMHPDTMSDRRGQAYSQYVPLGVVDGAESMLAFGQPEPGNNHFPRHIVDQVPLWSSGGLKPSPTTWSNQGTASDPDYFVGVLEAIRNQTFAFIPPNTGAECHDTGVEGP